MRSLLLLVLMPSIGTPVLGGTIDALYLTGLQFGTGPNIPRIEVVQGTSVINAWDQARPFDLEESAIAVASNVATWAGICSGACDPFPPYTSEYTLSGAFIGTSSTTAPLSSPGQRDYLYDGTTDGTHNYAVGSLTGNVYQFDSSWHNPALLFTLPDSGGFGAWWGITYDPTNDSVWVSTVGRRIDNYTTAGQLLSSFFTGSGYNAATGLALDPTDQTLWIVRENTISTFDVQLQQYSKQGGLLFSSSYPDLQTFDIVGAEFQIGGLASAPEPSSGLLLMGGMCVFCLLLRRRTLPSR